MSSINDQKELRIVLVGKTGCGKSSLGNSLLSRNCFKSSSIGESVTSSCDFGKSTMKNGTKLVIVDTPGLFDTGKTQAETQHELIKCITLSAPGPHAFIFVLKVGRVTSEELHTIERLIDIFGKDVLDHVIIVFTDKDKLEYDEITIRDFIKKVPKDLTELLKRCEYRYTAINNRAKGDCLKADVDSIMDLVEDNKGTFYTDDMYEKAESIMKEKIAAKEEEKMGQQREIQQQIVDLKAREKSVENSEVQLAKLIADAEAVKNRDARSEVRTEISSSAEIASSAIAMILSFFKDFVPLIARAVEQGDA